MHHCLSLLNLDKQLNRSEYSKQASILDAVLVEVRHGIDLSK